MIKIRAWNIRGLNDPCQHEARKLIIDHNLSLLGVVEAKVRQLNLCGVVQRSFPRHWDYIHNIGTEVAARILFSWDTLICKVSLVQSALQHITCKIEHMQTRLERHFMHL